MIDEFTEVLVEGDEHAPREPSDLHDAFVRSPRALFYGPSNIDSRKSQRLDDLSRDVLIRKVGRHDGSGQRKGGFFLERLRRIPKGGENIFFAQMGVVLQDPFVRPSFGKQLEKELDGDSGALDDGLADQDLGIDRNALFPVHSFVV